MFDRLFTPSQLDLAFTVWLRNGLVFFDDLLKTLNHSHLCARTTRCQRLITFFPSKCFSSYPNPSPEDQHSQFFKVWPRIVVQQNVKKQQCWRCVKDVSVLCCRVVNQLVPACPVSTYRCTTLFAT